MSTADTTTEAFADTRPSDAADLPDHAPIPKSALGPALNEQGYEYTGRMAAVDVFTASTAFWVMESVRLDLGYGSQVHR